MDTYYKKVSVKERLPKEGFTFYTSKGMLYFYSKSNPNNDYGDDVFSCRMEHISPEYPEWWLEPFTLPSKEGATEYFTKSAEEILDLDMVLQRWVEKDLPNAPSQRELCLEAMHEFALSQQREKKREINSDSLDKYIRDKKVDLKSPISVSLLLELLELMEGYAKNIIKNK